MSMKKTDLAKNLAKKLDGRLKSVSAPSRFGKGSEAAHANGEARVVETAVAKPVLVSCRLPAALVKQLRERAAAEAGGINAVMTQALEQWLRATPGA